MTSLQRKIRIGGAAAALIALAFPPICWMNDRDSAETRFYFFTAIPKEHLDPSIFLWPVTLFLLVLEWLGILVITAIAAWLAGKFAEKQVKLIPH